jgi:hypothetical protein
MSCQSCGPALEVRIENSDGPAAQFAIRLILNSIRQHVSFRRGKSRAAGAMRSLHVAAHSQALPDGLSAPEAIDACIDDAIRAADSVRARPLPSNTQAHARAQTGSGAAHDRSSGWARMRSVHRRRGMTTSDDSAPAGRGRVQQLYQRLSGRRLTRRASSSRMTR